MLRSPCPIHDVTHFGVTHYAMHPALSTNTNCTCNFMATGATGATGANGRKRAKRAKRSMIETGEGSSSSSAAAAATCDPRSHAKVKDLDCNMDFGWGNIMGYATAGERVHVCSLVSVALGRCAANLKTSATFKAKQGGVLVLADRSIALDRVEAATVRFPALKDVSVNLAYALSDSNAFTYARRAPILAKLCTFTFVTTLDLWGNGLRVVPDAIGALTNLKYLRLGGNEIATLPNTIGRLTALEELHLAYNKLVTLPDAIGSLTALTTLDLHGNKLTAVPTTIGSLTALTTLTLGGNELVTLPDEIGQLTGLTELGLSNNKLAILPDSIGQLTNLTRLNLYDNPHFIFSPQTPAVQAWLEALEDNATCDVDMD